MVTRSFLNQDNIRGINTELTALSSTVGRTILPVLGLTAAFSILGGGFNDATASGRAASSTMFQLQASTYGLQEVITRLLLPGLDAIIPPLTTIINLIVAADEATDSWSTRIGGAAAILAFLNRQRIGGVLSRLIYGTGAGAAAGAAAGVGGRAAAAGAVALSRSGAFGYTVGAGGAAAAGGGLAGAAAVAAPVALAVGAGYLGYETVGLARRQHAAATYNSRVARERELQAADAGNLDPNRALPGIPDSLRGQYGYAPQVSNTFYITGVDDEDLIRRMREIFENQAIQLDGGR